MLKILFLTFSAAYGLLLWFHKNPEGLPSWSEEVLLGATVLLGLLIVWKSWRHLRAMIHDMNE